MGWEEALRVLVTLQTKYMDCMDVEDDDPQRLACKEAFVVLCQVMEDAQLDKTLLDYLDSCANDDFPRFVANKSRIGAGVHIRSCYCRHEADNIRDAIQKMRQKQEVCTSNSKSFFSSKCRIPLPERTQYRKIALRKRSMDLRVYGGIEGRYRQMQREGASRAEIADWLGMSLSSLCKWITVWNREQGTGKSDGLY